MLVPLLYLGLRAVEADLSYSVGLLFRPRTLHLLGNTLWLAAGVWAVATLIATPLAYLTTRTSLARIRFVGLVGVLPLALPAYVLAYAFRAVGGSAGPLSALTGTIYAPISGYAGAVLALGIYTFPYLYLNLRSALLGMDASLEETARSLGLGRSATFWRVVVPQLRPAWLAGSLLVLLHVLGDFGVVSLMRFETFSYALYVQYSSAYDRTYAAWLALMLLGMTSGVLWAEARMLGRMAWYRAGRSAGRPLPMVDLGLWTPLAWLFVGMVVVGTLLLPLATIVYWLVQAKAQVSGFGLAIAHSLQVAAPSAVLAAALTLPIAHLVVRSPSRISRLLERGAYLGYATPPLAFGLAWIFFSLRAFPVAYQTIGLLIVVYALHYVAEGLGPVRTALQQASPRLEEAARSLGKTAWGAFRSVTLPLLRRGLATSAAFVFLAAMKELPLAFLLAPPGFRPLALRVWGFAHEAMFGQAAPYALAIVAVSAVFVGMLIMRQQVFRVPDQGRKAGRTGRTL